MTARRTDLTGTYVDDDGNVVNWRAFIRPGGMLVAYDEIPSIPADEGDVPIEAPRDTVETPDAADVPEPVVADVAPLERKRRGAPAA